MVALLLKRWVLGQQATMQLDDRRWQTWTRLSLRIFTRLRSLSRRFTLKYESALPVDAIRPQRSSESLTSPHRAARRKGAS